MDIKERLKEIGLSHNEIKVHYVPPDQRSHIMEPTLAHKAAQTICDSGSFRLGVLVENLCGIDEGHIIEYDCHPGFSSNPG